jgi:hypothetical protein
MLRRANVVIITSCTVYSWSALAVYDKTKLNDWKYHAYICKNTVMALNIMLVAEQKNGSDAVKRNETEIKKAIAESILSQEKKYKFDEIDVEFIADIVFAVRGGFDAGNVAFSMPNIQNHGFDICVSILDKYDGDLRK